MSREFANRVAVVTGGGSGIGEAISILLSEGGARVAVLDLQPDSAKLTATLAGDALAIGADVSDSAAVDAAAQQVEDELGPIDIWINNAGITDREHRALIDPALHQQAEEAQRGPVTTPTHSIVQLTDERWSKMLAVHLDGTFYGTRAAARHMGPRKSGAIVNIASICGMIGCPNSAHYSAAKAGVLGFTRAAARELAVEGIRVNAVAPGYVETPMVAGMDDLPRLRLVGQTPLGRLARPQEIAETAVWLASDAASYLAGATISPNGGLVMV